MALWGDPEVTRLFNKEPWSERQVEERLKKEIKRAEVHGVQYWPMFELATDEHVGCCGLQPYRLEEEIFELGYHLRSDRWGKGFATEAAKTVLDYGMNTLNLSGLFAGHHPDNTASRNVLLKLGFEEIGTEFYEPTGLMHPGYMFRRTISRH